MKRVKCDNWFCQTRIPKSKWGHKRVLCEECAKIQPPPSIQLYPHQVKLWNAIMLGKDVHMNTSKGPVKLKTGAGRGE